MSVLLEKLMLKYLTLFLFLLMPGGGQPHSTGVAGVELVDEEYAVYSALINQKHITHNPPFLIIIDQAQANPHMVREIEHEDKRVLLSPYSASTMESFKKNNKEPKTLKAAFSLDVKYTLMTNNEHLEIFKDDNIKGWEEFYKRHPGAAGFIRLSRVGFNPAQDEALVYIEDGCGATCGSGFCVLLTKQKKTWRVEKEVPIWVA